jgi:hypothetical protein
MVNYDSIRVRFDLSTTKTDLYIFSKFSTQAGKQAGAKKEKEKVFRLRIEWSVDTLETTGLRDEKQRRKGSVRSPMKPEQTLSRLS